MDRTEFKKKVVSDMIKIYCRAKHKEDMELCSDCKELQAYTVKRLELCRNKGNKITCRECTVKCYSKDMKSRIRQVMTFSGPRFFIRRPLDVIRYMI